MWCVTKKSLHEIAAEWAGALFDESDLLARSLWMRQSHSTQAQSMASHCRLTSPTGERMFTYAQQGLLWLAVKLHQGHATGTRDIENGLILSGQPSYVEGSKAKFAGRRSSNLRVMEVETSVSLYLFVSWKRFKMKILSRLSLRSVMTWDLGSIQSMLIFVPWRSRLNLSNNSVTPFHAASKGMSMNFSCFTWPPLRSVTSQRMWIIDWV